MYCTVSCHQKHSWSSHFSGCVDWVLDIAFVIQQVSCFVGYGNTWPNECWQGAWLLIVHQVAGMILNAVTVGIIFSRVSYPQQRGRTIAISDSAVIARRDGILKFMFRIADIRQTQVLPCLLTSCNVRNTTMHSYM